MSPISVQDILDKKEFKSLARTLNGKLDGFLSKAKIGKEEGIDELLQCLNPATFDFNCIARNLSWLFNSFANNFYLGCNLGPFTPHETDPNRRVASGTCSSFWGIPVIGTPQRCTDFDSISKAFQTCKAKCSAEGLTYEASGCDGMTIWCWGRVP